MQVDASSNNLKDNIDDFVESLDKDTLILSGGGIHGISHLGAIHFLNEKNILDNITTYCGTSIGALLITMIVIGFTPIELFDFMVNLNLGALKNFSFMSLVYKFGLDDGSRIEYVIKTLFKVKGIDENITFKQLFDKNNKKLIITAVCNNKFCVEYFSYETFPDMPIILAIRMSISVPGIFIPITYKDSIYTDGGSIV